VPSSSASGGAAPIVTGTALARELPSCIVYSRRAQTRLQRDHAPAAEHVDAGGGGRQDGLFSQLLSKHRVWQREAEGICPEPVRL